MSEQTSSIHIVRRYGHVGGMERYVWELTNALAKQGQNVKVVCEKQFDQTHPSIEVIELGSVRQKPRWLAMLRFSKRVSAYFEATDCSGWVIHSHERTACHHVTTFHGPPIGDRKKSVLDCLSPRLQTWSYLERREICAHKVKYVLPNSLLISEQLADLYPEAKSKLCEPAYPGVDEAFYNLQSNRNGKTIGFIGREWKRKGLDIAVKAVELARKENSDLKLLVAGPAPDEVAHLFSNWPEESYELLGWAKTEDVLSRIDLLIHPARKEPFGMVIAEANAAGVPVLISTNCGISPLIKEGMGKVLSIDNLQEWPANLLQLVNLVDEKKLDLSWDALASQHINLYQRIVQPDG
ncbi:MAG: glycosyltransferase family 4 protein [Neptuniibacter sp.]